MKQVFLFLITLVFFPNQLLTQHSWQIESYPDELGFMKRNAGMLHKIAAIEYGERSKAYSKCPDTQLPVRTWAVEGEEIISPYTGRKYIQGPTGYFAPKKRNAQGQIIAFGGDPLKYDLPPATATLLLNPADPIARAFLRIPGNLNQQYHFAAMNWARFYPLMSDKMGNRWIENFTGAVSNYRELRRPSDGDREHAYLSHPHDLVGEPGELLGGNVKDGGTENHKTMWRTTALLYSQLFPEGSKISGYSLAEAENITMKMISDYFSKSLQVGNGEYDSQIYYPYSIGAFLNLYDFSPDEKTRLLAKSILDFYLATYGLKVIDGVIAGAQKRGYLSRGHDNMMETYLWMWTGKNEKYNDRTNVMTTIQQATTNYRPNEVIYNIISKNVPLPFEAKISRPSYHMKEGNVYQESFYCSHSFGIGNVAMGMVDNPTQQMVWSMVAKGKKGPLCFGGGQPRFLSPAGHSPYTQSVHSKGTLILLTGQTSVNKNPETVEEKHRQQHANEQLEYVNVPKGFDRDRLLSFMDASRKMLGTWLFIPKNADTIVREANRFFIEANNTFVDVQAIGNNIAFVNPDLQDGPNIPRKLQIFNQYNVIVAQGEYSGFVLDAREKTSYQTFKTFMREAKKQTKLDKSMLKKHGSISYHSLYDDDLVMTYNPKKLRADGVINAEKMDYENWNNGAVYSSPYIRIENGKMKVSDGIDQYTVELNGTEIRYF